MQAGLAAGQPGQPGSPPNFLSCCTALDFSCFFFLSFILHWKLQPRERAFGKAAAADAAAGRAHQRHPREELPWSCGRMDATFSSFELWFGLCSARCFGAATCCARTPVSTRAKVKAGALSFGSPSRKSTFPPFL